MKNKTKVVYQESQDVKINTPFDPKIQIEAKSYRARLGLINFINAHAQIRDCIRFTPQRVLIIGGGRLGSGDSSIMGY